MIRLLWLDTETNGLNPEQHCIIAVGMRVTTADLEPIDELEVVVPFDMGGPDDRAFDGPARMMHIKSGLYDRCAILNMAKVTVLVHEAWRSVTAFLDKHAPLGVDMPLRPRLAGNNVGKFDMAFMTRALGWSFVERVHYRTVDVSTLHETAKLYAPSMLEGCPGKRDVHMPLADIDDAIALFRHLRGAMGLDRVAA